MESENRKRALGKGLGALISDSYSVDSKEEKAPQTSPDPLASANTPANAVLNIPIKDILANPKQPRLEIEKEKLAELAESILEQGILQPIVVTKVAGNYQLICGERRLRASTLAGRETIPAIVKEIASDKMLEVALVENIQRQDLNPIEEAVAYGKLIEEQKLSQEEVAKRVGKDRSTVTNSLRLLRLPDEVQALVSAQAISAGHARALVALVSPEHQRVVAKRVVKENLSVRRTEEIVQEHLSGKRRARRVRKIDPFVKDLEGRLEGQFGTKVRVFHNKKNQGRIELCYFSLDDLDRILQSLGIEPS